MGFDARELSDIFTPHRLRFKPCSFLLPPPLAACSHLLPALAVSSRLLPYLTVSCRLLPSHTVSYRLLSLLNASCRLLPSPATSCRIFPSLAVYFRLLPPLAVSCLVLPRLPRYLFFLSYPWSLLNSYCRVDVYSSVNSWYCLGLMSIFIIFT